MKNNLKLKYEIAKELNLLEKVEKDGWNSLSPLESGKIGGIMSGRIRKDKNKRRV